MVKVISTVVTILVIALFPPAALALVSQNAIPGDRTYPIKRKLEDGILLALSVRPSWKAGFSVVKSDRRLQESQALIASGKDASVTLTELVTTTNVAATEIKNADVAEQRILSQNLVNSINNYQIKLTVAEQEAAKVTANVPLQTPTPAQQAQAVTSGINLPTPQPVVISVQQIETTKKQLDSIKQKVEKDKKEKEVQGKGSSKQD